MNYVFENVEASNDIIKQLVSWTLIEDINLRLFCQSFCDKLTIAYVIFISLSLYFYYVLWTLGKERVQIARQF